MMRGGVTFDALGKPRELRFSTNALCRLEERGVALLRQFDLLIEGPDAPPILQQLLSHATHPLYGRQVYRLLMWGGLGDVTLEDAGDIMDAIGMVETDRIIADALRAAFPTPDGDAGNVKATAA